LDRKRGEGASVIREGERSSKKVITVPGERDFVNRTCPEKKQKDVTSGGKKRVKGRSATGSWRRGLFWGKGGPIVTRDQGKDYRE